MSESFKRTFQIDSHRRTSGTTSDFQYQIVLPPLGGASAEGLSVVLLAASVPKSYYLIPAGRNTFTLTENGVAITITVPPGNYTIGSFVTAVTALMNAATQNGSVYAMAFSIITGKITYTVVGGPSSITAPATPISGVQDQLGVEPGVKYTMPFTGPDVVTFASKAVLQIRTDLVSNGDNVLEQIYAPQFADFSTVAITQTDLDARAKPLSSKANTAPRFYICDEDEQPVDLNGQNVCLSIMIYRPLEYVMREYIKMRSFDSMSNPHAATERALAKMVKLLRELLTQKEEEEPLYNGRFVVSEDPGVRRQRELAAILPTTAAAPPAATTDEKSPA